MSAEPTPAKPQHHQPQSQSQQHQPQPQPKPKLLILISGNGSNLQAIIDNVRSGYLNANIIGVISNNANAYGLHRASTAGIKNFTLNASPKVSREAYDQQLLSLLETHQLDPDWIVLAGFMRVLSASFVNRFHDRIINIHPSLLPKYKGLNTHQRVLENGDQHHGCTVHRVTAELDDGPMLSQAKLEVQSNQTEDSLIARVHQLEHLLFSLTLASLFQHKTYDSDQNLWRALEPNQDFQLPVLDEAQLTQAVTAWKNQ